MDIKECYEMLGITKKATDEQVKKAYREKSKQFHPDLHRDDKDATAKFAKVSEAYRLILENREKKHKSIFNFGTIFSDAGIKMNTEKKKETTKYQMINQMLSAKQHGKEEELKDVLETYRQREAWIASLFRLME